MSKLRGEHKFDLRTLEQELRDGDLNLKEYQSYVNSLDDCADNVDYVEVYEEPKLEEGVTASMDTLTFSPDDPTSNHS